MSVEIIILCVTGVVACLTYLVKHFKKSECWSKDSCCVCKMDKNDSKSDLSIESIEEKSTKEYVEKEDANLELSKNNSLPQKRDHISSSDLKVTVSSVV